MAEPQSQTAAITKPEVSGEKSDVQTESTSDNITEAGPSASGSAKKCGHCGKVKSGSEEPLKPCSKCQTVCYCSRDCQKANWKQHKKTCATSAQIYAQTADFKPASAPRVSKKDAHRGGLQKWQFDT